MKFKFIKPDCKNVGAYDVRNISTGDTVEFTGNAAEKAKSNPDFELVKAKKAVKKDGNSSGNKRQSSVKARS